MRKILCTLLAALMCLSLLPLTALAEAPDEIVDVGIEDIVEPKENDVADDTYDETLIDLTPESESELDEEDLGPTVDGTSITQAQAVAWAASMVGQELDYDGVYGCQCVDFIKYYYKFLGVSPVSGNGCDYATNTLPSGWSRIEGAQPQPGDILVYTGTSSNPYGHVAIYESDYVHYDQNVSGYTGVVKCTWYYQNGYGLNVYWGVVRPNFGESTSVSVSFATNDYQHIVEDEEIVLGKRATVSGTTLWNLSTVGIDVYDNNGTWIGGESETPSVSDNYKNNYNYLDIWYYTSSELGLSLQKGSTYQYRFNAVVNGTTYYSDWESFTVPGAVYYTLDVNGWLDGSSAYNVDGYGTFDVYINGSLVADNVSDYCASWPSGTTYEITDIQPATGKEYAGVYSGSLSGTVSSDLDIKPIFNTKTYTITYNANGGSGAPSSQTKTYGTALTLSSTTPTRTGYTFLGWATSSTATSATYSASGSYTANSDATLYAVWGESSASAPSAGDINGDSTVSSDDVARLMQYIKYGNVEVVADVLDVNGDGEINYKDVTRLSRYVKYADVDIYPKVFTVSDWVLASSVPSNAEIVDEKWIYTKRNYTSSSSSTLSGWTLYDTQRTGWGSWSDWSTTYPGDGVGNVESQSVYDHTEYHYYRWISYSAKGVYTYQYNSSYVLEEQWFTYQLPTTSQYSSLGYVGTDSVMNWWVRADYSGNRSVDTTFTRSVNRTEYRYQDPIYTYYFYQDVSMESSTDPTGLSDVSNVVKWVTYIEK